MSSPLNISLLNFLSPDSVVVDETTSTMELARQMLEAGAGHMGVAMAETQTAGRGRRQKTWHTFSGHSLAFTVVVRKAGPHLPLVASVAICQALQKLGVKGVKIKWPNDVLINSKKVSGILAEGAGQGAYLLGIGLNVSTPDNLPKGFPGTTIEAEFNPLAREEVFNTILAGLNQKIDAYIKNGWPALAKEYEESCITINKKVTWQAGETTLKGVAQGLDKEGALLLNVNGKITAITSGEIIDQA